MLARSLFWLAVATALLATGCAPLHYTLRPGLPGATDVVVVPPHLPPDAQIAGGVFRVVFPGILVEPACSFDTGAFAAHPAPDTLVVTTHAGADATALAALRAQILRLAAAGCFRRTPIADPVWRVLQALPLDSADAVALSTSDTLPSHYFEILPGEQLQIITPLLNRSGKVVGPATLWYTVAVASGGRLRMIPPSRAQLRALDPKHEGLHPQMLTLPRDPVARYWRVAILGSAARLDDIRTNVVLASSDLGALAAATSEVVARPEACAMMTGSVRCFAPKFGTVIRLPWIAVSVHGRALHLPHDATVADALKAAGARVRAQTKLRVKRLYGGQLIAVRAQPSLLLQLHLLGGERIDW